MRVAGALAHRCPGSSHRPGRQPVERGLGRPHARRTSGTDSRAGGAATPSPPRASGHVLPVPLTSRTAALLTGEHTHVMDIRDCYAFPPGAPGRTRHRPHPFPPKSSPPPGTPAARRHSFPGSRPPAHAPRRHAHARTQAQPPPRTKICAPAPAPRTQHPAPSTQHPAPSTQHPHPHPAPGTRHPAPGTRHPAPGTRHHPPRTRCPSRTSLRVRKGLSLKGWWRPLDQADRAGGRRRGRRAILVQRMAPAPSHAPQPFITQQGGHRTQGACTAAPGTLSPPSPCCPLPPAHTAGAPDVSRALPLSPAGTALEDPDTPRHPNRARLAPRSAAASSAGPKRRRAAATAETVTARTPRTKSRGTGPAAVPPARRDPTSCSPAPAPPCRDALPTPLGHGKHGRRRALGPPSTSRHLPARAARPVTGRAAQAAVRAVRAMQPVRGTRAVPCARGATRAGQPVRAGRAGSCRYGRNSPRSAPHRRSVESAPGSGDGLREGRTARPSQGRARARPGGGTGWRRRGPAKVPAPPREPARRHPGGDAAPEGMTADRMRAAPRGAGRPHEGLTEGPPGSTGAAGSALVSWACRRCSPTAGCPGRDRTRPGASG